MDTEREEGRDFTEECSKVVIRRPPVWPSPCLSERRIHSCSHATFYRLLVLHLYWIAHSAACQGLCCLAGAISLHCPSHL